jgi:uncharacterized protein YdhG (YjbR/CyaY superfamily)
MPCLIWQGKPLAAVMVRKNYISLYPYSSRAISAAAPLLAGFATTSGSVHFTPERPIPEPALAAIIAARAAEIGRT